MRGQLHRLRRDERGISLVYISLGFMGFLSATTLAIDVGMFMTARSQAQNAADAGALAGAVALAFNDFDDRSPTSPAVRGAISTAQDNLVMGAPASVGTADVTFPNDPSGQPTRVSVSVYRAEIRDNPIPTLMGSLFGVNTVSLGASATAEASPANAETCVKPFTIPDKWQEAQTSPWDPDDDFNMFDNKGKPLANPDIYIPADGASLRVANYLGFFIEGLQGNQVVGRITPVSGVFDGNAGPAPAGAFPKSIRLVE
jgi:Putative Flp pilus-assembly TadE/G-like